jgi:hypothetical protein
MSSEDHTNTIDKQIDRPTFHHSLLPTSRLMRLSQGAFHMTGS